MAGILSGEGPFFVHRETPDRIPLARKPGMPGAADGGAYA